MDANMWDTGMRIVHGNLVDIQTDQEAGFGSLTQRTQTKL